MACVPRGSCYDAKTHAIGLKDVHEHEHDKEGMFLAHNRSYVWAPLMYNIP